MDNIIMEISDESHLMSILFGAIGLETDDNGYIHDQDTGQILLYNRKKLCLGTRLDNRSVVFNILRMKNLAKFIFSYFSEKILIEDSVYISLFSESFDRETKSSSVEIIMLDQHSGKSTKLSGNKYHNISLAYIDMIFVMNGLSVKIPEWMDNNDHIQQSSKIYNRQRRKAPKK